MKDILAKTGNGYSKLMVYMGYISTIFLLVFYNPWYSYLHIVATLEWEFTTQYVFIFLAGLILIMPTFLDLPKAWEATGKGDKFIFFVGASVMYALGWTTGILVNPMEESNWHIWVLFTEISVIAFMLWGSYVMHRYMSKYRTLGTKEQGTQDVNIDNADDLTDDCTDCDLDTGR